MNFSLFLKYWLPVLVWLGLIFIGSTDLMSAENTSRFLIPFLHWLDPHISWAAINAIHTVIRKLGHVTEYAILAVLLSRALRSGKSFKARTATFFVLVWFACGIFAASDELHQSFVRSRTPSARDAMIDIGGAFVGLLVCWTFTAKEKRP
jgi:VanZ family protein